MKILEFKLDATNAQEALIDEWLNQLRWIWNQGLALLEEAQQRRWRQIANIPDDYPQVEWYRLPNIDKEPVFACKCTNFYKGTISFATPIRPHAHLEDPKTLVTKVQTNKANPNRLWLHAICSRVRNGIIKDLQESWDRYLKGTARRPKYKGKNNKLRSLSNLNGSTTVSFTRINGTDNAYAKFPILGRVTIKGFYKRYGGEPYSVAKIIKEPTGYYLHLTCAIPGPVYKDSDRPVGLDPGLKSIMTTDNGREIKPPRGYRLAQKRLRIFQRKVSRQKDGSTSQKATRLCVAREHEVIRRSRNAFNHKLSTKIVREYGAIALEDLAVANLNRRPKPILGVDGKTYEKNHAKAKSGLNKSFADAGLGDLKLKLKSKAEAAPNREIVLIPPAFTTINCSGCGNPVKKSLSMRTHVCNECGLVIGRDVNAALNILNKGRELFSKPYRMY